MAFARLTVTCVCVCVTTCLGSALTRSILSCLCVSVCYGVRACVLCVRSSGCLCAGGRSYDLDCTSAQLPPNGCLPCQCTPPDVYETVLTQHLQAVMAAAQTCVLCAFVLVCFPPASGLCACVLAGVRAGCVCLCVCLGARLLVGLCVRACLCLFVRALSLCFVRVCAFVCPCAACSSISLQLCPCVLPPPPTHPSVVTSRHSASSRVTSRHVALLCPLHGERPVCVVPRPRCY
jgi:hypothetical protein